MEWTKEAIRRLRFDLNDLSREAFGNKVGVAAITVFRWEHGQTHPEPESIKKLNKLQEKSKII